MLLIFDLERIFAKGGNRFLLDQLLEESWAGEVLAAMREHYEIDLQRRREQAQREDPAFVRAERERKKLDRAKRHAERVAKKDERYKKWLEKKSLGGIRSKRP
jgi:site-specific recombinase